MSIESGGRMKLSSPRRSGWKRMEEGLPRERLIPGRDNIAEGGSRRTTTMIAKICPSFGLYVDFWAAVKLGYFWWWTDHVLTFRRCREYSRNTPLHKELDLGVLLKRFPHGNMRRRRRWW